MNQIGKFWNRLWLMQNLHYFDSANPQHPNNHAYIILDISKYTSEAAHQ